MYAIYIRADPCSMAFLIELDKNFNVKHISLFVTFKQLSYCFEEIIGFEVKALLARRPVSILIEPGDLTK